MIYCRYIFYKTYLFFFRMNAQDMPGVKALLLTGFVALANCVLLLNIFAGWLDYDTAHLAGILFAKVCLVGSQLGLWFAGYRLFWCDNKLASTLLQFEEHTVSFNALLATCLTSAFYLLPVGLLVLNSIKGAHLYALHK